MTLRKPLTALAAALMIASASIPTMAHAEFVCGTDPATNPYDKDVIAAGLTDMAEALRCVADSSELNPGLWSLDPIWEQRREPSCDVHLNLARKLYEVRDFDANPDRPKKNKNDTNLATGAAWDVQFSKFVDALSKLDSFLDDAGKARLNSAFPAAADYRYLLTRDAQIARDCVYQLSIL